VVSQAGGPVNALLSQAEREVDTIDHVPFSPQAFDIVKLKIASYIRSLIVESAKIARRKQSDVISASHVEQASDYLIANTSQRWLRHLGTVGGILLGASLSNFLSMTTANQYSAIGVVASALLAVAGAFGVALHIARD
jgi:hypothetical protein